LAVNHVSKPTGALVVKGKGIYGDIGAKVDKVFGCKGFGDDSVLIFPKVRIFS
jgi:hypothetical protein